MTVPSDALTSLRARSKALLGGSYRAEVGRAISELGADLWTLADLTSRVAEDVSGSCVNKELNVLLDNDFVLRNGKNEKGQYLYLTSGVPEYWALAKALTQPAEPSRGKSVVVPLRPKRREAPRA